MSTEFTAQKVLAHLRVANEVSKRLQDRMEKEASDSAAISALIPDAVNALEKHERIFGHQKEAVAEGLQSHAACIELIRDLAAHRNSDELNAIGKQVGQEKKASAKGRAVGSHIADWDETDAGAKFRQKLMGG